MGQGNTLRRRLYDELVDTLVHMGYPEVFGHDIADQLGSEKAMRRMIGYLHDRGHIAAERITAALSVTACVCALACLKYMPVLRMTAAGGGSMRAGGGGPSGGGGGAAAPAGCRRMRWRHSLDSGPRKRRWLIRCIKMINKLL